ncbi:hypothetical protein [Aeromonas veronii]|uniref:hypothetical protein n=1 Tax=Aeromonas veronii TaxID=654 RepID=UPI003005F3CF
MSYLYDGKTYDNYDHDFMAALGMSAGAIESVIRQAEYERHEGQLEKRKRAYQLESDPLLAEWQFDQTAEAEQIWRDKVAEIKARYPLTVES